MTPKGTDLPETSQEEFVTPKVTDLLEKMQKGPVTTAKELATTTKDVVEKSTEKIVKTEKKAIPEEVEEAVFWSLDDDEGDSTLMWGADSVLKEQEMLLLVLLMGCLSQTIPQMITQTEPPKPKRQS